MPITMSQLQAAAAEAEQQEQQEQDQLNDASTTVVEDGEVKTELNGSQTGEEES
jgi:hypothetical protein